MSVEEFIGGLTTDYDSWNDTYRVNYFRDNLNGFSQLSNSTQVRSSQTLLLASCIMPRETS